MSDGLLQIRPNLEVADVPRSIEFYRRTLGLDPVTTMGEPPEFAILASGTASIAIARAAHPAVASIAACYVDVADVAATYQRCSDSGVEVTNPLTTHPWNMRDFVFRDIDGHQIAVGQQVDGA